MKRVVVLLMILAMASIVIGQKTNLIEEVEVSPPKFISTTNIKNVNQETTLTISEYLGKNFSYEYRAGEYQNEGIEIVQFVISPTGTLSDFQIINSLSPEIDDEIIRVLKSTDGMWKPGMRNNEPVAMRKEVSLGFVSNYRDLSEFEKEALKIARINYVRATNLFLERGHPRRALAYYNQGIQYLPNDKALLLIRGLCRYDLNDKEGAYLDWQRIIDLGGLDYCTYYVENIERLEGFTEFLSYLDSQQRE